MNSSDFGGFESDDLGDSSSRGSTRPARPFGFAAIEPEPFNPFADDEPSYSSSRFGHSDSNRGGLAADEHGGWQSRSPTATSPVAATFHVDDPAEQETTVAEVAVESSVPEVGESKTSIDNNNNSNNSSKSNNNKDDADNSATTEPSSVLSESGAINNVTKQVQNASLKDASELTSNNAELSSADPLNFTSAEPTTQTTVSKPVQSASVNQPASSTAADVPVQQSQPYLIIEVSNPHKIGDNPLTSYVVYRVHTRTTLPQFKSPDVIVRRRYTDFVWLFNQLSATHPGAIVPPLPEKQSLGRFEDEFIESRRAALARFLSSVARHPLFRDHVDFQIFLESDSFGAESAERKRVVDEAVAKAHKQVGAQMTSDGGLFSFFAGALSSTFVPTFVEFDSWFENRRLRVDQLETQLRLFLKAVEGIVVHRRELAGAHQEFGESLQTLAKAEPHLPLAASISALGELQIILKALHDKQADNDTVSLLQTADEHLRTMGSIKLGFQARVKAWQSWEIALNDFGRKRAQHEKAARQAQQTGNYASSNDISRIGRLRSECGILEIDCSKKEDQFELITGRLKSELERFDNLKIEDFCKAIDDSLESMVELQAQVVAQWEKFLSSATANMSNFTAAQRD